MKRDDEGFHYHRPGAGSVTRIAADAAPDGVDVVGAFHNLAAARLANLDADLGIDTLVIGDDEDAKGTVIDVAEGIEGLRALDAGGIARAGNRGTHAASNQRRREQRRAQRPRDQVYITRGRRPFR